jgi:hypothetical protein
MGGNMKPGDGRGMRMAPHCEDASGNHAAVLPDGSCPSGYTLDDKGGMRMAPHCEDASGNHAAVLPNGSCPSGYTLDDKGGMPGQMGPAVSPSATPQS